MRVILKGEKQASRTQARVASLHHCADKEARFALHSAHSRYSVCRRLHLHASIKRTL
ncbi:hypothetical protein CBM2626_B10106 [Cupriavidus taiwanensis]|uniref:Uncharacterized protein n=1 Tax=Cupriavidus taiwanensis TaxID=164546 RepID=A0A976AZX6_9BURK|nr:hypothetical protein CBM2615_B10324 [Cupriavidus taiwanensis]SOZ62433.1 hypothetical protein CBM2614_B10232 [Cupriavidus taiwanensis]SOZ66522.1 hypothetical protein CBM2613_B10324 [Cupriavidus taiwanensis]SPA00907.1 hypothetical protein CBM2626_B10106 [Cupriavidus taiwanensis]SPA07630.1 hypothetical protein CBM2625_B10325 [Cupriavidus taiwanensis]